MRFHSLVLIIPALLLSPLSVLSQEVPNAKAEKVHKVLLKRPNPGYLYDRFYNAWLDTGSLEGLEGFLAKQVEENESTGTRLLLAFFHAKQRDHVSALEQFRLALEDDPGNAAVWFEKATIEAKTLDFETAISDLEKAAAGDPKEDLAIDIAKLQGKLHLRSGETDKALAVWAKLLEERPDDEDLREDLIELQVTEGLYEEALKTGTALAEQTKDVYKKVIRQMRLGDIHHRSGDRDKALEAYGNTLEQVGHGTWLEKEILAQIDQVFRREENMVGLDEHYQKLIETHPKRLALRQRHADLLKELGLNERAVTAYDEILKLTPGERSYREAYIEMLASLEDHEKAITQQEQLIDAHPEDGELLIKLAGLYHAAKKPDETTATLNTYIEKSDHSEYVYLRAARLFERYLMFEQAASVYEQLTAKHPDSSAAHEAHAAFLHGQENKEEAIAIWTRLADGTQRPELVRIARSLMTRHEHQAAFDLLHARYEDFSKDTIYLGELCQAAIALDKHEKAIPWARARVQFAGNAFDLENAIDLVAKLVQQVDQLMPLIASLKEESPRSLNDSCLLADLLERNGESQAATATLEAASGETPEAKLLVLTQRIRLLKQRYDWVGAAEATEALVELPGGRKSVYIQKLIELYEKAFEMEKALSWISEWKRLSPGSIQPWVTEAKLLRQQDRYDDSVEVLRRAVQQFEGDEQLRAELASVYAEQGKMADASRMYWNLYEEAEQLSDKLSWVKSLASMAQSEGKTDQLVEQFEERRASNRTSVLPLLALAEIHRMTSNYEERRAALLEATRMRPEDIQLLHEIARIEESEGNWQAALQTLESAKALDQSLRTARKIAQIHLNYGNEEDGFQVLNDLAGGPTMDAREAESIADSMIGTFYYDQAREFLEPFVAKYPDDYRLGYLYAICLEEEWKTKEALDFFLRLLAIDQEMPGLSAHQQNQSMGRYSYQEKYLNQLREYVPHSVVDLIRQSYVDPYRAYYYRQANRRRGRSYGWSSSYAMQGNVTLPDSLARVPMLVIPHIATLAFDLSDDEKEALYQRLEGDGIQYPDLLISFAANRNRRLDFEAFFEKYPDDEVLEAYWIVQGMHSHWDEAIAKRVFAKFRDSYPQLALTVALHHNALSNEDFGDIVAEGIEIIDGMDQPSAIIITLIARALGQAAQGRSNIILSKEDQKRLSMKIRDWYPALDDRERSQVYHYMSLVLRGEDDLAPFFDFLEEELNRMAKASRSTSGVSHVTAMTGIYSSRGRNAPLLQPLLFPPPLTTIPDQIIAQIVPIADPNRRSHSSSEVLDPEKVKACLEKIKNPLLRVLAAYHAGEEDTAEKTLNELVSAKDPQIDSFILAAAFAADHEESEKAVELLEKASYLPLDRHWRSRLDGALVSWALDADKDSALRQTGSEAALRLRRQMLTAPQRTELAEAMEALGMAKASEQLIAKNAASGIMGSNPARNRYGNSRTPSRVERMINEDRYDQALKTAVQELRRHANNYLSPSNMDTAFYDAREVVQPVTVHSLTAELMKLAAPPENAGYRHQAQYAMILLMLGKKEDAYERFKQIVAERPQDEGSRMRLFLLAAELDPDEAAGHLLKLRPHVLGNLGYPIRNLIQRTQDFDKRAALVQVVRQYLESIEDTNKIDLSWTQEIVEVLADNFYQNNIQLPNLYQRRDDSYRGSSDNEEEREELSKKRRQMHDDFCRAMLKVPQLALEGFRRLGSLRVYEGKDDDETFEMAKQAMLTYKPFRGQRHNSRYHRSNQITFYQADQYLVKGAWERGKLNILPEEILPALRSSKRTQEARQLEKYYEMFECAPEGFVRIAQAYAQNPGNSGNIFLSKSHALSAIIDAWRARELEADISGIVLEFFKSLRGQSGNYPFLIDYGVEICKREGSQGVEAFFESLAELFLGRAEQRAAYVKRHYNPRTWSGNTPNGDIHIFQSILNEVGLNEHLTFVAARFYRKNEFHKLNRYGDPLGRLMNNSLVQDSEAVIPLITNSPWLNELKAFDFLRRLESNNDETYFHWIIKALKHDDAKDSREKVLALVKETEPSTFGSQLMEAALDGEPQDLAEVMASHAEKIRTLPSEKREGFASFIRSTYSDLNELPELSETASAFIKEFHGFRSQSGDDEITEFLSAKPNPATLNRNTDDEARRLIGGLFQRYPDDASKVEVAKEVLFTAADRIEKARRSGNWSRYSGNQTDAGRLLQSLIGSGEATANHVRLLLDVVGVAGENGQEVELSESSLRYFGQRFARTLQEQTSKSSEEQKSLEYFQKIYEAYAGVVGDRETGLLFGVIHDFLNNASAETEVVESFVEWLEEKAEDEGQAREMAMAVRYWMNRQQGNEERDDSEPTAEEAHYVNLLAKESIPAAWRLALGARLLSNEQSGYQSFSLRLAAAELLAASMGKKKTPIPDNEATMIIRGLIAVKDRGDQWTAAAEAITGGWLKLQIQEQARVGRYGRGNSNSSHLQLILELALAVGADQPLNRMINHHAEALGQQAGSLILLVKHGEYERAANLLRKSWMHMGNHYQDQVYDKGLEDHFTPFLDSVENKDNAYFARVILSAIPDPQEASSLEGRQGTVEDEAGNEEIAKTNIELKSRNDRMVEAAAQFSKQTFKSKLIRERVLAMLAENYATKDYLKEILAQETAKLDLEALLSIDNSQLREQRLKIVTAHIGHAAAQGDPEPFLKAYEIAKEIKTGNDYYRRRAIDEFAKSFLSGLKDQWVHWEPGVQKAALPVTRQIAFMPKDLRYNFDGSSLSTVAVAHLVHGEFDAFAEAFEQLDSNWRPNYESYLEWHYLAGAMGEMLHMDHVSAETRLQVVVEGLEHPLLAKRLQSRGSGLFNELVEKKVLSREELLGAGPRLVALHPRDGYTASEFARMAKEDENWDRAFSFYDIALRYAPSHSRRYSFLLEKANLLQERKRHEEQYLHLSAFDPKWVSSEGRDAFLSMKAETLNTLELAEHPNPLYEVASRVLSEDPNDRTAWMAVAAHSVREADSARSNGDLTTAAGWYRVACAIMDRVSNESSEQMWLPRNRWEGEWAGLSASHLENVLVRRGATWHYLDDGSDQQTTWRAPDYDHNEWKSGEAPLGYGDDDKKTVVGSGEDDKHHITTYFRHAFEVEEASRFSGLLLDLNRDDGAVVYLNGEEIRRDNMTTGEFGFKTLASSVVSGSRESAYFSSWTTDQHLVTGLNVLAVEIHQQQSSSSDISFDLQVTGLAKTVTDLLAENPLNEALSVLQHEDGLPDEIVALLKK